MHADEFRELIDRYLEEEKSIAGTPRWVPGPRLKAEHQHRWQASLAVAGQIIDLRLIIDAYPLESSETVTIQVVFSPTDLIIVRVEFGEFATHMNKPPVPGGCPEYLVQGPHMHSWEDNKALWKNPYKPTPLAYARYLPNNLKNFENCFRWFCGAHNIKIEEAPEYPKLDVIL